MTSGARSTCTPKWLRCFFVILGTMTLIFRRTILQMILQVLIEDLVEGLGFLVARIIDY